MTIEEIRRNLVRALELFPRIKFSANMNADPSHVFDTESFDSIMDRIEEQEVGSRKDEDDEDDEDEDDEDEDEDDEDDEDDE